MAAYAIFDIEVTNPERWPEYSELARIAGEKYGGKLSIISDGTAETIEGDWHPHRIVVLEFDDVEHAKRWYFSPEYQKAAEIRKGASNSKAVIIGGMQMHSA